MFLACKFCHTQTPLKVVSSKNKIDVLRMFFFFVFTADLVLINC